MWRGRVTGVKQMGGGSPSPCVVAAQHHRDGVGHQPLPVVVTDAGVLPGDAEQQI